MLLHLFRTGHDATGTRIRRGTARGAGHVLVHNPYLTRTVRDVPPRSLTLTEEDEVSRLARIALLVRPAESVCGVVHQGGEHAVRELGWSTAVSYPARCGGSFQAEVVRLEVLGGLANGGSARGVAGSRQLIIHGK